MSTFTGSLLARLVRAEVDLSVSFQLLVLLTSVLTPLVSGTGNV
jgi:hypothetical protein